MSAVSIRFSGTIETCCPGFQFSQLKEHSSQTFRWFPQVSGSCSLDVMSIDLEESAIYEHEDGTSETVWFDNQKIEEKLRNFLSDIRTHESVFRSPGRPIFLFGKEYRGLDQFDACSLWIASPTAHFSFLLAEKYMVDWMRTFQKSISRGRNVQFSTRALFSDPDRFRFNKMVDDFLVCSKPLFLPTYDMCNFQV